MEIQLQTKKERIAGKNIACEVTIKHGQQATVYRHSKNGLYILNGREIFTELSQEVANIFSRNQKLFPEKFIQVNDPKTLGIAFYKFATDKEKPRLKTLQDNGILYLKDGWIQIRSWQKIKGRLTQSPKRTGEINKAIRMMQHILDTYKLQNDKAGEISQIRNIEEILLSINIFLSNWKTKGSVNKEKIERDIAKLILSLQYCRNDFKVSARDKLLHSLELKDSLNRLNPPAIAARILSTIGDIRQRIDEFRFILPKIALRYELLKFEKDCFEMEKETAISFVKKIICEQKNFVATRNNKKFIHTMINKIIYHVHRFWVNPYHQAYLVVFPLLETARENFDRDLVLPARNELSKVLYILENEI